MKLLAQESEGKALGKGKPQPSWFPLRLYLVKPSGMSVQKAFFSPALFPCFFPGCKASGMAALSAGSIVASPHSGHCSFRLISPPMRFPPLAVIGGSSAGPEAQPRQANHPRSSPQQREPNRFYKFCLIRYCGSRVLSTLVGPGVKPQRFPLLYFRPLQHGC